MNLLEVATAAWLIGDKLQWGIRYAPAFPTRKSASRRADQGARVGQMFWVEVELDLRSDLEIIKSFFKRVVDRNYGQKAIWDVCYPHRLPQGYRVGNPL